ncbi:unnamed protein product [Didymodactylos carnosus]|uniref:Uncharacterized protein n=1 Tax=Didymodactylos carnosus TaxID=1234261 RepID=A0A815U7A6_9BILA|nr:unnamed protein product [Didymodactylos carnosus]CAF4376751.1 unnamed protein product [Didymodactylos carnosus]
MVSLSKSKVMEEKMEEKIEEDTDVVLMRDMGYEQELFRGFSGLMSLTFCFTAVNVLCSISIGFNYGVNTGGPGVIIWGWIIGSFFTIIIGLSLAEICSTYPSAGSVYHWAGQLVPIKYSPIASFICGWFNFLGNVAGDAAFSSGFASLINAAVVLNSAQNVANVANVTDVINVTLPSINQAPLNINTQVGVSIGVTALWSIQNALRIDKQGWLNNLAAFVQVGSTITIVAVILIMTKYRASARTVFLTTYNTTGFTFGYVCIIGILSTLFSFSGYEAGAHLAEETRGAGKAAPKGIVGTCVISACIGFAYLLGLLFAIPNVDDFVNNSDNPNLGEFNLGKFGVLIGTKDNMNWAIIVVAGVAVIATVYWLVSARHWFVGPKRAIDLPDDKNNNSSDTIHPIETISSNDL